MIRVNPISVSGLKSHKISVELLVLLYFLVSLGISIVLRANTAATDGFFAELGNVSASLASGNGFANVFGSSSGPTAWCPVLNVFCYALVFYIFGVKTVAAFWALIVIRCILFSISLWWLLKLDYSPVFDRFKIWLVPIFLGFTTLVIFRTGPKDAMFSIFLSVFTISTLVGCWRNGLSPHIWSLIALAIMLPLASISLAIGLVVFLAAFFILKRSTLNRSNVLQAITVLGIVLITFSIWGYRNSQDLGKFIPYKSNLWFEMYISNVKDDDGLLKYSNYRKYHPYTNKQVAKEYEAAGEVAFLHDYQNASVEYLASEPLDFVNKIVNRFINIFIFAKSERDIELASVSDFSAGDLHLLEQAGLIVDNYWVCLEDGAADIQRSINALALDKPDVVSSDWSEKSMISQSRVNNIHDPNELIKGLVTSIIPLMALIFGLVVPGIRNNPVFLIALFLFLLSIGPYLVISWTPRYQSFQLGFFTIFIFLMCAQVLSYWGINRGPSAVKNRGI